MGKDLQVPSRSPLKIHLPGNIPCLQLYFEGYMLADCVDFELFCVLILQSTKSYGLEKMMYVTLTVSPFLTKIVVR